MLQVVAGGAGALLDVVAFVDVGVHLQAEVAPGALHELPHPGSSGARAGQGVEAALNDGQILQVVRQAVLFQYRLDDGEVAIGALDGQHRRGVHVGEGHQFAVHPLAQVVAVQGDDFVGKADFLRHLERHTVGQGFRLDGIAFGAEVVIAHQERNRRAHAKGKDGGQGGVLELGSVHFFSISCVSATSPTRTGGSVARKILKFDIASR